MFFNIEQHKLKQHKINIKEKHVSFYII